jgi:hypothetical protein
MDHKTAKIQSLLRTSPFFAVSISLMKHSLKKTSRMKITSMWRPLQPSSRTIAAHLFLPRQVMGVCSARTKETADTV